MSTEEQLSPPAVLATSCLLLLPSVGSSEAAGIYEYTHLLLSRRWWIDGDGERQRPHAARAA